MISSTSNKTVILCSTIAVTGMACIAAGVISFNLAHHSAVKLNQEVMRAAKVDRFAVPEVTYTAANRGKPDGSGKSPASQVVFKSARTGQDNGAVRAGADQKSNLSSTPANDVTVTTTDADRNPAAARSDTTTAPAKSDDTSVVVEPAAGTRKTSTNVSEEPEVSNPASKFDWSYSRELMDRTERRARFLWDILMGRD